MSPQPTPGPRLSHLVLNVRDIEASQRFYTEALGFEQCGAMGPGSRIGDMRFFRGDPGYHHHIALVQTIEPSDDPRRWDILSTHVGVNHIALAYGSRDEFLARIQHLRDAGVDFLMRGDHGMTHSVYVQDPDGNGIEVLYDLPEEVWEGDVNAALNFFDPLPLEGGESLADSTDYVRFGVS